MSREAKKATERILRAFGRELFASHVAYVDGYCTHQAPPVTDGGMRYRTRRVLLAVAILALTFAMAATVIGIVRPQIFYEIKERIDGWDIRFSRTSDETVSSGFRYIKPGAPEGFVISEEIKGGSNYFIEYTNDKGESIQYEQMRPDAATASIYNEDGKISHRTINGRKAIITEWKDSNMIVIQDGEYVYDLEGNCSLNILYAMAERLTEQGEEAAAPEFEYVRPRIPEGYRITEEAKTFEDYDITMEDDAGHVIYYLQMGIDGTSLDLFNEKEDIRQTEINGRNAIVSHNGEMHTILIEDGKYAYLLEGECDYDTLLDIVKKLMGG